MITMRSTAVALGLTALAPLCHSLPIPEFPHDIVHKQEGFNISVPAVKVASPSPSKNHPYWCCTLGSRNDQLYEYCQYEWYANGREQGGGGDSEDHAYPFDHPFHPQAKQWEIQQPWPQCNLNRKEKRDYPPLPKWHKPGFPHPDGDGDNDEWGMPEGGRDYLGHPTDPVRPGLWGWPPPLGAHFTKRREERCGRLPVNESFPAGRQLSLGCLQVLTQQSLEVDGALTEKATVNKTTDISGSLNFTLKADKVRVDEMPIKRAEPPADPHDPALMHGESHHNRDEDEHDDTRPNPLPENKPSNNNPSLPKMHFPSDSFENPREALPEQAPPGGPQIIEARRKLLLKPWYIHPNHRNRTLEGRGITDALQQAADRVTGEIIYKLVPKKVIEAFKPGFKDQDKENVEKEEREAWQGEGDVGKKKIKQLKHQLEENEEDEEDSEERRAAYRMQQEERKKWLEKHGMGPRPAPKEIKKENARGKDSKRIVKRDDDDDNLENLRKKAKTRSFLDSLGFQWVDQLNRKFKAYMRDHEDEMERLFWDLGKSKRSEASPPHGELQRRTPDEDDRSDSELLYAAEQKYGMQDEWQVALNERASAMYSAKAQLPRLEAEVWSQKQKIKDKQEQITTSKQYREYLDHWSPPPNDDDGDRSARSHDGKKSGTHWRDEMFDEALKNKEKTLKELEEELDGLKDRYGDARRRISEEEEYLWKIKKDGPFGKKAERFSHAVGPCLLDCGS